eukprot:7257829-Prymnesium_polylepis.1
MRAIRRAGGSGGSGSRSGRRGRGCSRRAAEAFPAARGRRRRTTVQYFDQSGDLLRKGTRGDGCQGVRVDTVGYRARA